MSYPLQNYTTGLRNSFENPMNIFFQAQLDYQPLPGTIPTDPIIQNIKIQQNGINSTVFVISIGRYDWVVDTSGEGTVRDISLSRNKPDYYWLFDKLEIRNPQTFSLNIINNNYTDPRLKDLKIKDVYNFQIFPSSVNPINLLATIVTISRSFSTTIVGNVGNVGNVGRSTSNIIQNINLVEIPSINILGQTLVDFSDVGNMNFTIDDEFTYYKEKPLKHSKCIAPKMIDRNKLKLTIFEVNCPLLVSVLRGKGDTLYVKAASIYKKGDLPQVYLKMILYGMLKFILSRILYGNFNVNYILNKYNHKFLKDLGSSRFCSFLEAFLNPQSEIFGYNQYFK